MSTGVVIVVLLAVLVLFGVGAAAVGWLPGLTEVPADAADDGLPAGPLQAADVEHARFGLAFRGYRMQDVDDVVERLAHELASRDHEIASLRSALAPPAPVAELPAEEQPLEPGAGVEQPADSVFAPIEARPTGYQRPADEPEPSSFPNLTKSPSPGATDDAEGS